MDEPSPDTIAQAVARVGRGDFQRWMQLVHASGCCAQPVRLAGRVLTVARDTGAVQLAYSTAGEPERVILKACQTRRATRCPACAALYQGDARALIIAGLAGGKGVPDTISDHPVIFATLTAPSFGPVHTETGADRTICQAAITCRCRPPTTRRCEQRHRGDDPAVGTPICPDCYDYQGTIIWNSQATRLWARTCIAICRALARSGGIPVRAFADRYRLSFVKVAEYQRRGVIHLHVLLRLDSHHGDTPTLERVDLDAAIRLAVGRSQAPNPLHPERPIRWGRQLDLEAVDSGERRKAANYLAKYATKSTDPHGALDHRLRHPDTSGLDLPDHLRRLVTTAWDLGGQPHLAHLNLRMWAHTLGYRGHWLTKSRHWSTTFGALRNARAQWHQQQHPQDERDNDDTVTLPDWDYRGVGHANPGDNWLARSASELKRQNRRTAWEEQA